MTTTTNRIAAQPQRQPLLALLLATLALLSFGSGSAQAAAEMPFHAQLMTRFDSSVEGDYLHLIVTGRGKATALGTTSALTTDQLVSLIDGSGSATYTLTGPNGDTLMLALVVEAGGTINVAGGVIFSGSYTVIRGTGEFEGATGSGVFGGSGFFLSDTHGIGAFALVGTIVPER